MPDDTDRAALRGRLLALTKGQLAGMLEDAARNRLAHDGLWFLAVEGQCGMETAISLDARAWEGFTAIEARRIMERHMNDCRVQSARARLSRPL